MPYPFGKNIFACIVNIGKLRCLLKTKSLNVFIIVLLKRYDAYFYRVIATNHGICSTI
jgi:hypothetical protein